MIRALTRHDLEQVAALYQKVVRGGGNTPDWLAPYFASTTLDHPWYDPELPSLVFEERGGAISGFLGVHVRRLRFDSTPIRLACSGQFTSDPDIGGGRGVFLLREFLAGAQDLSITDGANDVARALWRRQGGTVRELECLSWSKVLRPARAGLDYAAARSPTRLRAALTAAGRAVDTAARAPRHRSDSLQEVSIARLEPSTLASTVREITAEARIAPDYDIPYAHWLLTTMAQPSDRGELRAMLVRSASGSTTGAFVYYRRRGGISRVICVLARPGALRTVVDALTDDARAGGASVVVGRLEPGLAETLTGRKFLLRYTGNALIHSRDVELLRSINAGEAWLTQLEGEYWMTHHLDRL